MKPADGSNGLSVLELAKSLGVVECLHKDFRKFLLVFGALILQFAMIQQHVHFRNQQCLCILELCN